MEQQVAFDTCTAINVLTCNRYAKRLRKKLRGKPLRIILCDMVVKELQKKRYNITQVILRIQNALGRSVHVGRMNEQHMAAGEQISARFHTCHTGDNYILAYCRSESIPLITDDRDFRRACNCMGVTAFFASEAGNI